MLLDDMIELKYGLFGDDVINLVMMFCYRRD